MEGEGERICKLGRHLPSSAGPHCPYKDSKPLPIFYLLEVSAAILSQICHFKISQNQHTWINLVSLSRAGRGFQDEEVETEVLQAWATFATGGEVIVQSFQASAPACT